MRIFLVISFLLGTVFFSTSQTEIKSTNTDIIIKASFIYNFAKHSKWPDSEAEGQKFRIAVFGDKSVYEELIDKYSTRAIQFNQIIEVVWITDASELEDIQVVYIARNKSDALTDISLMAQVQNILVISDFEPIDSQIGSISFTVVDNTISFNVNKTQAEKCGVQLGNRIIDWANKIIEK